MSFDMDQLVGSSLRSFCIELTVNMTTTILLC